MTLNVKIYFVTFCVAFAIFFVECDISHLYTCTKFKEQNDNHTFWNVKNHKRQKGIKWCRKKLPILVLNFKKLQKYFFDTWHHFDNKLEFREDKNICGTKICYSCEWKIFIIFFQQLFVPSTFCVFKVVNYALFNRKA